MLNIKFLSMNVCETKTVVHRTPCNRTLLLILHSSPLMLSQSIRSTTTTSLASSSSSSPDPVSNLRIWTLRDPLTGYAAYCAHTSFLAFIWLLISSHTSIGLNIPALSSLPGNILEFYTYQKIPGHSQALSFDLHLSASYNYCCRALYLTCSPLLMWLIRNHSAKIINYFIDK